MARQDSPQSAAPKKAGRFARKKATAGAPKKAGRFAQIRQVFTAARAVDTMIGWWMALASLGTLIVMVGIGVLFDKWLYSVLTAQRLVLRAAARRR